MNVCIVCEKTAWYKHTHGSLLSYWWVEWFCEEHACMDCIKVAMEPQWLEKI